MVKTCCLNWMLCNNPITQQFCLPCCLPIKYCDNHVLPCCSFVVGRAVNSVCCDFVCCPKYYDCTFPPVPWSVGLLDICQCNNCLIDFLCLPIFTACNCCISTATMWKRAGDGSPVLFKDGIRPTDVAQGMNGDCWLPTAAR